MAATSVASSVSLAEGERKTKHKLPSQINLDDVIDMWEAQKSVCGGSHAEFAKHLLILHKAYCSSYCEVHVLQKKVLQALWTDRASPHLPGQEEPAQSIKDEPEDYLNLIQPDNGGHTNKWLQTIPPSDNSKSSSVQEPENLLSPSFSSIRNSDSEPRKNSENTAGDNATGDNTAVNYNDAQPPEEHTHTIQTSTRLHVIEPQPTEELSNSEQHLSSTTQRESGECWSVDGLSAVSQAGQLQQNSQELVESVKVNPWSALKHLPSDATPNLPDVDEDSSDDDTVIESDLDSSEGLEEDDSDSDSTQQDAEKNLKPHSCYDCGKTFQKIRDLKRHMLTHTGEKPHICADCGKGFGREWSLKMHKMKSHTGNEPYSCSTCRETFKNMKKFKKHMRDSHDGEGLQDLKSHLCTYCSKAFGTLRDMNRHILTHTGEKPHVCPDCKKGFTQNWYLKIHMRMHSNDTPQKPDKSHLCSGCDERFRSIKSMKKHMQDIHDGEGLENLKDHLCTYCGKAFSKVRDMDRHILTHTGERPHVCTECGKGFTTNWYLKTHMKTAHSGEPPKKPFLCSQCGKSFGHLGSLKSHMMSHTGEMPYVCSYCGKGYTAALKLKAHVMMHTGEKPFLCTYCGKGFTRSDNLSSHMRIHTGESHVCIDCCKEFKSKRGLQKHTRRLHPS